MTLYLNILLALLAIPILILPLEGKLRDKRVKANLGFTKKGLWFYIFIILATLVTGFKEYVSNQEEYTKDKETSAWQTTIKDTLSIKFRNQETKLLEIEEKTQRSLEEREKALARFDKVSSQLNRVAENETQKIKLDKPELVFKDPYFKFEDSTVQKYSLSIPLINVGKRTAYNFKIKTLAFEVSNDTILACYEMPLAIIPETNIPSKVKGYDGKVVNYYVNFIDSIKNYKSSMLLYIFIEYTDSVSNEKFNAKGYYTWRGYQKDQFKFIGSSKKEYELVNEDMKKPKFIFKDDN